MLECTRPHKLNTAIQRRVRAAEKDTVGRMWPAGRSLPTPTVEEDTHTKSAIDDEVTEESFGNCEAGNLQGLEGGCLSEQPLPTLAKGKA